MKTFFMSFFTLLLSLSAQAREEICDCRFNQAEQSYGQYCYLPSPEGPNWEEWGRWTGKPCGRRTATGMQSTLSQGEILVCQSDQYAWATIEITTERVGFISFKITDTTPNRQGDIGAIASLRYKQTVRPNGRTFFKYDGEFEPGFHQRTLSVYLSEDNKTLTRFVSGLPNHYSCY